MQRSRIWVALVASLWVLTGASAALADAAPEPAEDPPPHAANSSCTVDNRESDDLECVTCELENPTYNADYEACERELAPWGYELACGDSWNEVFCRDRNVAHEYDPDAAGETEGEGCSIATGRRQTAPVQVGLALAIISIGLLALRRFK